MTGRIRTVKPEWLEDEQLALAGSDARVLSIALLLLADDHGRGRANRVMLAGQIFPGKPLDTLAKALEDLVNIRYVLVYELDGQSYFEIRNWSKHQKVDHPGKPKVPPPPSAPSEKQPIFEDSREHRENLSKPTETLAPDQDQYQDQDLGPVPTKGSSRVRAEPAAAAPAKVPANWDQAMQVPLAERARSALEQPEAWSWAEPHRWPEVVGVAAELARAAGEARPRLGDVRRDAGVRAVLGLFADGWTMQELVPLVGTVGRSKWYREGGRKGLSSLTAEVLRRAQNERGREAQMDPEIAKELRRTRAMRAEMAGE